MPSGDHEEGDLELMKATLIACTQFYADTAEELTGWTTDAQGADALSEFAGRACYQSWDKPNPATASNRDYLANIAKQEHFSVLEHGTATFYITGVSRSLTHELIRHRHFSYSELSQRFVNVEEAALILPPAISDDDMSTMQAMATVNFHARRVYREIVDKLQAAGRPRKQAREAARAVMMNAVETRIVVTGNHRAWRHFLAMRGTQHADREICRLAVSIAWELKRAAPSIYQDAHLRQEEDGREIVVWY